MRNLHVLREARCPGALRTHLHMQKVLQEGGPLPLLQGADLQEAENFQAGMTLAASEKDAAPCPELSASSCMSAPQFVHKESFLRNRHPPTGARGTRVLHVYFTCKFRLVGVGFLLEQLSRGADIVMERGLKGGSRDELGALT